MTKREESLARARLACDYIKTVVLRQLWPENQRQIECLIAEFERLDAKEQKQIKAGKKGAPHGVKGGRPKEEE